MRQTKHREVETLDQSCTATSRWQPRLNLDWKRTEHICRETWRNLRRRKVWNARVRGNTWKPGVSLSHTVSFNAINYSIDSSQWSIRTMGLTYLPTNAFSWRNVFTFARMQTHIHTRKCHAEMMTVISGLVGFREIIIFFFFLLTYIF